jgi:hypothetical protein
LNYDEDFYLNTLNVGECIVKIKNRVEPCLVKTPLVDVQKELVTDDWLRVHGLSSMFGKYAWKGEDNPNYLGLKNAVNDILSGKGCGAKKEKKRNISSVENTPPELYDNTRGYYPTQTLRNTTGERSSVQNADHEAPYLPHANIKKKKGKYPPKTRPQHRLLIDVLENPFSTITDRYKRLSLHPKLGNRCRKDLISEKCVQPRKIITGKGWITLFEITRKGKMVLTDLGYDFKNESEGVVHKYWKNKIAEYYKALGLDVRVEEYYVNGRPDIIVRKDGKKIAVEIETGKSDYVKNVLQGLEAGFDEVVCVAVNLFVERKIRRELEKREVIDERVRSVCVKRFGARN